MKNLDSDQDKHQEILSFRATEQDGYVDKMSTEIGTDLLLAVVDNPHLDYISSLGVFRHLVERYLDRGGDLVSSSLKSYYNAKAGILDPPRGPQEHESDPESEDVSQADPGAL